MLEIKRKSMASCRKHVTRCNLGLQLAMVSKQSMQSLQKVGPSSIFCNRCKPKKLRDKLLKATLLTQRFLTFRCVPYVKIKNTDVVLPVKEGPQLPVMVIIPLNFTRCTLPTHIEIVKCGQPQPESNLLP